jgi:hypothetical protein
MIAGRSFNTVAFELLQPAQAPWIGWRRSSTRRFH